MYNEIVGFIEAIKDENDNRVFPTVGYWNDQVNNQPTEIPDCYPACFIQFEEIAWRTPQDAGGYHTGVAEEQVGEPSIVIIHIVHSYLEDETVSFPLQHPINQLVYYALQKKGSALYGPLLRQAEIPPLNFGRLADWQMRFRYTLTQTGQIVDKVAVEPGTIGLNIGGPDA